MRERPQGSEYIRWVYIHTEFLLSSYEQAGQLNVKGRVTNLFKTEFDVPEGRSSDNFLGHPRDFILRPILPPVRLMIICMKLQVFL